MARMMLLWHPDSPGMRVWARVPWWRVRTARRWGFATISDALLWARREDATAAQDGAGVMSANILTERQRCARECQWTWWRTDGHFDFGDVRRCEHGRIWRATGGRALALAGATSYDRWEPVPRFTFAHRRAARALAQDGAR